jgi:hypothetical protein
MFMIYDLIALIMELKTFLLSIIDFLQLNDQSI